MATINKMSTRDLISAYHCLIEAFKNHSSTPDDSEPDITEVRLKNIENEIEKRQPGYFEKLQHAEVFDSIYDTYYTPEQVAVVFDVSKQTIYNWIGKSMLPVIKIGNKTYISKKVIERVKQNGTFEENTST